MRGKSKFERKQAVLEVDEFVVEAVTVLPHEQYNRFANNLLYDYDFIIEQNDMMRVDSDGITHVLLVLDEEGEDGILVNSEGSAYARYTGYMSGAKKKLRDEIKEIVDAIIQGRFGDTGKGSWVVGFDDVKEHFDLTVNQTNGIGEMLIEELESREEVGEIIATEDCLEITEYLSQAPANVESGDWKDAGPLTLVNPFTTITVAFFAPAPSATPTDKISEGKLAPPSFKAATLNE
jgi:hypothetical protein